MAKWILKKYLNMSHSKQEYEFSIVKGGLLDRLLIFLRITKPNQFSPLRKIIFFVAVTWLPLLVLTFIENLIWTDAVEVSFAEEFATHIRFLIVIPLLVFAEGIVDQRVKLSLGQFNRSGLLTEEGKGKFELAKRKADQMSESIWAESVILGLIFLNLFVRISANSIDISNWAFPVSEDSTVLSKAGYWAAFVSFPLIQFLILRWMWRWLIWLRLLNMISKAGLRIIPQHPDKSGGLGFLGESPLPFSIFTFTLSIIFSAILAERVLFQGFVLEEHYPLIAAFVVLCVLINVVPLLTFISVLSKARIKGINDFHALVAHHHLNFYDKWIRNQEKQEENILGSPDVSSAADISMVYDSVKSMGVFPFNIKTMAVTVIISLLPVLGVFALEVPMAEILKTLVGFLL
jgi:hypothetical protein